MANPVGPTCPRPPQAGGTFAPRKGRRPPGRRKGRTRPRHNPLTLPRAAPRWAAPPRPRARSLFLIPAEHPWPPCVKAQARGGVRGGLGSTLGEGVPPPFENFEVSNGSRFSRLGLNIAGVVFAYAVRGPRDRVVWPSVRLKVVKQPCDARFRLRRDVVASCGGFLRGSRTWNQGPLVGSLVTWTCYLGLGTRPPSVGSPQNGRLHLLSGRRHTAR